MVCGVAHGHFTAFVQFHNDLMDFSQFPSIFREIQRPARPPMGEFLYPSSSPLAGRPHSTTGRLVGLPKTNAAFYLSTPQNQGITTAASPIPHRPFREIPAVLRLSQNSQFYFVSLIPNESLASLPPCRGGNTQTNWDSHKSRPYQADKNSHVWEISTRHFGQSRTGMRFSSLILCAAQDQQFKHGFSPTGDPGFSQLYLHIS